MKEAGDVVVLLVAGEEALSFGMTESKEERATEMPKLPAAER